MSLPPDDMSFLEQVLDPMEGALVREFREGVKTCFFVHICRRHLSSAAEIYQVLVLMSWGGGRKEMYKIAPPFSFYALHEKWS